MEVSGLFAVVLLATVITAWPHETRRQQSSDYTSGSHHITKRRKIVDDDDIVFPNDGCLKKFDDDICEIAANYPVDHIRNIVAKSNLKHELGTIQGTLISKETRSKADELLSVCASESSVIYPQKMTNLQKISKLIVNDESLKQGITVEKCKSDSTGRSQNKCQGTFPIGYKTKCQQTYATVRLLSVSATNNSEIENDTFTVPCCCTCKYNNEETKP